MAPAKDTEVKRGISVLWETLQCPICLDLLTQPVSTKCDHQFCKFCMLKLLDNSKLSRADCPVCKEKITKRSLRESPGFQRLVAGLQDMIQAYEHDTGTNYFTGLAREGRRSQPNDNKQVDATPDNVEGVEKALPSSHSSTTAALNGFARVMGFKDSNPLMTEDEVQEGSVQTPQSVELIEATVKSSRLANGRKRRKDQVVPAFMGSQPLTQSPRKKQKKDEVEDQDQIFENMRRRSKEKVAEWLMKVPTEGSLQLEEPTEVAHVCADSDSSSSVPDVPTFNKKEQIGKTLEAHVFGLTYKRKLRVNQSAGSKPASNASKKLSKKKKTTSLSPADFTKSPKEKLVHLEEPVTMDVSEEMANCETHKKNLDEPPENNEVTSVETLQPEHKLTKRLRSTLQHVNSDLPAKVETKGSSARKSDKRRGTSERGKSARAVKPLLLVGVQNGDGAAKSKLPPEEVQVHIENYPSSEDQEAVFTTGTRKSRRLQLSVQNVRQPAPKKALTRQRAKTLRKDVKDGGTSNPSDANACKSNGCIYDKEICEIEDMEISRLVPLTENEAGADRDPPLVPSSASLFGAVPEDPAPRSIESSQEDCNDSEMDTAQLLRSFKATKRKSFCLARSTEKRSEDEEIAHSPEKSDSMKSGVQGAKQQTPPRSDLTVPSTCSDLIPPTDSCARKMDAKVVAALVLPRTTVSSGFSPNKVTARETESPLASFVPQVVDSGLRFHERQKTPESHFESAAGNCPETTSQHPLNPDCSLTPDGLGVRPEHSTHGTQTSVHSSVLSDPSRKTRRRTRRLQYSSESLSSSSEKLPTLAQIFHQGAPHHPDDTDANRHEADDVAVRCETPDCVTASQASVDLFDSPDEYDVPANGACVSAESSQFTSEVLVTQQKLEMQQDLVRLEKLMALVTEVLQEKEANPAVCPNVQKLGPCEPDASRDSDRKDLAEEEQPIRHPHDGEQFPQPAVETPPPQAAKSSADSNPTSSDKENKAPQRGGSRAKMVLASSGLAPAEQTVVRRFAKRVGARVVSQVTAEVTHVVMCTDEHLVCERTLKYFLGIASRKWVVSFQWIAECFKQKKLLDESLFEVRGDVVNGSEHLGPKRARTTRDDNLLMKGYEICFQGPFTNMTTEEMEWMVQLCGAAVAKDPLALDKRKSNQLVIVQPGSEPCSYSSLAKQATVVTRGWLLDSVATYTLQGYGNYLMS
ncbi:uncharacterized protein LOC144004688 isoform X2 [Festucalex cinctus]